MEELKATKIGKLHRLQADIGRRIDSSIRRDDYTELLHLESVYKRLALQIARISQTVDVTNSNKESRGY